MGEASALATDAAPQSCDMRLRYSPSAKARRPRSPTQAAPSYRANTADGIPMLTCCLRTMLEDASTAVISEPLRDHATRAHVVT